MLHPARILRMTGKKVRPDVKGIVGANVKALVDARHKDMAAACEHLKIKETQLKRIIAGRHAVTMTTVERIAAAYDLAAYQLLVPGLDPRNPQVLRKLSADEEKFYKMLEELRGRGDKP